jgi:hypothetical protein
MSTFRVGLYARVSTAEQRTLPMQVANLRNYAERRGWTVTACIEDVASGAKERPKRQELIKIAKRREIEGILVWRLDRWDRSVTDLIGSFQDLSLNLVHGKFDPGSFALKSMMRQFEKGRVRACARAAAGLSIARLIRRGLLECCARGRWRLTKETPSLLTYRMGVTIWTKT